MYFPCYAGTQPMFFLLLHYHQRVDRHFDWDGGRCQNQTPKRESFEGRRKEEKDVVAVAGGERVLLIAFLPPSKGSSRLGGKRGRRPAHSFSAGKVRSRCHQATTKAAARGSSRSRGRGCGRHDEEGGHTHKAPMTQRNSNSDL